MTKSLYLAEEVSNVCQIKRGHAQLIKGRMKNAEVYPPELCKTVRIGLATQMKEDGRVNESQSGTFAILEEDCLVWGGIEKIWDDLTGEWLDPTIVMRAKQEEIDEFRNRGMHMNIRLETGKAPLGAGNVTLT